MDASGAPVEGVFVDVYPWDEEHGQPAATPAVWPVFYRRYEFVDGNSPLSVRSFTDAAGALLVPLLPVGVDLRVTISEGVVSEGRTVRIPTQDRRLRVSFVAAGGATVRGRVVSSAGFPQGAIPLRIADQRGNKIPHGYVITNERGEFSIDAVPSGTMILELERFSVRNLVFQVTGSEHDLGNVIVDASVELEGRVALDPEVRTRFPREIQGVGLVAERGGRVLANAKPLEDDTFKIRVPAGPVELRAYDLGRLVGSVHVEAPVRDVVLPIDLARSGIRFRIAGVQEPTVVKIAARPVDSSRPAYATLRSTTENKRGGLKWRSNELVHQSLPPGRYLLGIDVPSVGGADLPIELSARDDLGLGVIEVGVGELRALVVDAAGTPVPGALVSAVHVPWDAPTRMTATTDAGGAVSFGRVACGLWSVCVGGDDDGGSPRSREVRLLPGAIGEVRLVSAVQGRIHVTAELDGRPVPGAEVKLFVTESGGSRFAIEPRRTGVDGTVVWDPVPEGSYRLLTTIPVPRFGPALILSSVAIREGAPTAKVVAAASSEPIEIVVKDGETPFIDMAEVHALGRGDSVGVVVSAREGRVRFAAVDDLELLCIRLASTTGKEKYGTGGEYVFADVRPGLPDKPLEARLCTGYVHMASEPAGQFPELQIEDSTLHHERLPWLRNRHIAWSDMPNGARRFWGIPIDCRLRTIYSAAGFLSEGDVILASEGPPHSQR